MHILKIIYFILIGTVQTNSYYSGLGICLNLQNCTLNLLALNKTLLYGPTYTQHYKYNGTANLGYLPNYNLDSVTKSS